MDSRALAADGHGPGAALPVLDGSHAAVPVLRAPDRISEISAPDPAPVAPRAEATDGEALRSELARVRAELRDEVARELTAAARRQNGPSASVLVVLAGMNLLLITGVLALARSMPAWEAGLLMTALLWLVAAGAALFGSRRRRRGRGRGVWERAWRAAELGLDAHTGPAPRTAHWPKEQ